MVVWVEWELGLFVLCVLQMGEIGERGVGVYLDLECLKNEEAK